MIKPNTALMRKLVKQVADLYEDGYDDVDIPGIVSALTDVELVGLSKVDLEWKQFDHEHYDIDIADAVDVEMAARFVKSVEERQK